MVVFWTLLLPALDLPVMLALGAGLLSSTCYNLGECQLELMPVTWTRQLELLCQHAVKVDVNGSDDNLQGG